MVDLKHGLKQDKIMNYLGETLTVDLKNHHRIVGTLAYYHLQEQMIHFMDWQEIDDSDKIIKQGKFMIINRTAWFQIYV